MIIGCVGARAVSFLSTMMLQEGIQELSKASDGTYPRSSVRLKETIDEYLTSPKYSSLTSPWTSTTKDWGLDIG
ncbi:unnamed protein product, partial [Allacma fusca]